MITQDRFSVRRLTSPESRKTLELAANYSRLLSSKNIANEDVLPAGRRLYAALIGAAGKEVQAGLRNLIIIPDRSLYYLPFEALVPGHDSDGARTGSRFLMEDYGISYAPSASTLVSILDRERPAAAGSDWLAVGDPVVGRVENDAGLRPAGGDILFEYYLDKRFVLHPLEFASREMASIARLIAPDRRRIVSGREATEERVKKLPLGDYRVLHFATHSLLDERAASRSSLFMTRDQASADDGFLQASEIYDMTLNADLVVLSACQTAGGKLERGEGIQGLARAFFCAGARSVVASLWNVNDEFSARFMEKYYGYLALGETKQEALRLTKIRMSRARNGDPYHWAAFVLIGEGAAGVPLQRAPWWRRAFHF
jgi:CHAT domain-containing protein